MIKKLCLIVMCIICIGTIKPANATGLSVLVGFGSYGTENSSISGLALSGYTDINISRNFTLSPTLNYWSGSEDDESVYDIAPALAFKYYIFPATVTVAPFIGLEPGLHILSGYGEAGYYLGLSGLGGLSVSLSDYMQIPFQISYGLIFGGEETMNAFVTQIGITLKL